MRAFSNPLLGMVAAVAMLAPLAGCFDSGEGSGDVNSPPRTDPTTDVPAPRNRFAAEQQRLDPRNDGWESEVFAEQALAQLKSLGKLLADPATIRPESLTSVAIEDVLCSQLRPDHLSTVLVDQPLTIRTSSAAVQAPPAKGLAGFAVALRRLARAEQDASPLEVHVKIVRVTLEADRAKTTVVYEASGRQPGVVFQQNATWLCTWQRRSDAPPRLSAITLQQFTEVERATSPGADRWFVDCTQSVLGRETGFREHLAHGMQHWLGRVERIHLMLYFQRHGLAVADVNGDGLDDLYVCQPGGLPNRLFLQRPDGTASEASASAGVDWLDHTASALLVDLDNDGDQDLVLATAEGVQVLANDGRARFDPVLTLATADSDLHSLCAADYDGDGDLDLYVTCDYARARARPGEKRQPFSYHDANDGGANLLFRNDHDPAWPGLWKFTDVTKPSGLDENNRRHSLAASWADYDGDGDLDLYVANDYGQNCLYRNTDGRFVDVAVAAGVVDQGSGMSVSWADFNHDGRLDLYVGNMFSSAGSRITRQAKFRADQAGDVRSIYQRFTKGNSLFSNTGDGKFDEVGATAGVEMGRWAWSSIFADINNDGWQDLIVANGFVTTDDPGDL